jgi:signal peptidase II
MTQRRWFGLRAGASNWLWLAVGVMALDQWTKSLIVDRFEEFDKIVLLPVLEIMRLHNEGAAFSVLSTAGGWQRWLFIGLASSSVVRSCGSGAAAEGSLLAAGLSLILAALGNVIDRVLLARSTSSCALRGALLSGVQRRDWRSIGAALVILDNLLELDRARAKKR